MASSDSEVETEFLLYMAVDAFCSRHSGRACKMLYGRGRSSNFLVPLYRAPSIGTVKFRGESDRCISAAICNAIHLLGDIELSYRYCRHFLYNATLFARTRDLPHVIRDFCDAQ